MFKKYSHIENTYQAGELIEKARLRAHELGLDKMPWICFRKIDGSNVQIIVNADGSISYGSRNQEIDLSKDDFSGFKAVVERDGLEEKCRELKRFICEIQQGLKPEETAVAIYGELYGGLYRHPDVPRDPTAVRVQGRIDYSPSNHWQVFDIALTQDNGETWKILSWPELREAAGWVGLDLELVQFMGTLDECLAFSPVFLDDTGQMLYGLPPVKDNYAEGVVIKPEIPFFIGDHRAMFKNKNPKYKERIKATKAASLEAKGQLNSLEAEWADKLCEFMNEPRAFSAKSKLGEGASFSDLMAEATRDALADFKAELGEEYEAVRRSHDPKDFDEKKITKALSKAAIPCVRAAYLSTSQNK